LAGAVESLIPNETAMLEKLAHMLHLIRQMQTRSEENQGSHSEQIHQFGILTASHFETRSAHQPIVVSAGKLGSEIPEINLLQQLCSFFQTRAQWILCPCWRDNRTSVGERLFRDRVRTFFRLILGD
jgi:hypothetical protein